MRNFVTETASYQQSMEIAAALAKQLKAGDVVLLIGDLGAGKTTFVRGACMQLGVKQPVRSPTFTIGQIYQGDIEVAHLDLYRLASLAEEDPELIDDYVTPQRVAFIEWPDAVAEPLNFAVEPITVTIQHRGEDRRYIEIK